MKAAQLDTRKSFTEKGEDGCAIHNSRFEQKTPAFLNRQVAQQAVAMHHRPFIGGNCVHALLESDLQMIDGALAGVVIDRRILKKHIPRTCLDEIDTIEWTFAGRELIQ